MRITAILFLLVVSIRAHANAGFDSLFLRSNFIVYGQVIRHENSGYQGDLDTRFCIVDILVHSVCEGGAPVKNLIRFPQPGDTIKNVDYLGGDEGDTMLLSTYFVFPMRYDSSGWILTHEDYHFGVFRDYDMLKVHCPIIYIPGDTIGSAPFKMVTSAKNGWKIVTLYYPNDQPETVSKSKWFGKKRIDKRVEYTDRGRKIERTRTKTNRVVHHVTWTFRKNGKPCLRRRSVWIID